MPARFPFSSALGSAAGPRRVEVGARAPGEDKGRKAAMEDLSENIQKGDLELDGKQHQVSMPMSPSYGIFTSH